MSPILFAHFQKSVAKVVTPILYLFGCRALPSDSAAKSVDRNSSAQEV
jgi:hypothetical protein